MQFLEETIKQTISGNSSTGLASGRK